VKQVMQAYFADRKIEEPAKEPAKKGAEESAKPGAVKKPDPKKPEARRPARSSQSEESAGPSGDAVDLETDNNIEDTVED
jgi:hypothetical protein